MTQSQVTITSSEREAAIVRTSAIGIAANVVLAAFKAAVGILSNSIAVFLMQSHQSLQLSEPNSLTKKLIANTLLVTGALNTSLQR